MKKLLLILLLIAGCGKKSTDSISQDPPVDQNACVRQNLNLIPESTLADSKMLQEFIVHTTRVAQRCHVRAQ